MRLLTDFTQGELSPRFKGRPDLELYQKGALEVTNFVPFFPGGITLRPGFKYLGSIGSAEVRLIPFIISDSVSYILEFGNKTLRFWKDGDLLLEDDEPLVIVTPYTDPFAIQYAQDSGVLYLASAEAKVYTLTFNAIDDFTLATLSIGGWEIMPFIGDITKGSVDVANVQSVKGLANGQSVTGQGIPKGATIVSITGSTVTLSHAATMSRLGANLYYSVTLPFQSTTNYPRAIAIHDGRLFLASTESEPNAIWASRPYDYSNFTYYEHFVSIVKELREPMNAFNGTLASGSPTVSGISVTDLEDMKVGDTIMGVGIPYEYPDIITRILTIGADSITLDHNATETGAKTLYSSWYDRQYPEYKDVQYERDVITPSNGYKKVLASDINEAILWLASGNDLIVGTTCGERVIPSGVTASNFLCKRQTAHGSARIQPVLFNDAIVFVGPDKKVMREYVYRGLSSESQAYYADRVDQFADHIFTEITQIDYQSSGYPVLWAVQDDGTLIGCVHDRRVNLSAFFRVEIEDALVESICIAPLEGKDILYASINRSGARSLEQLGDLFDEKHLDSYVEKVVVAGAVTGISWISGAAKLVYDGELYSVTVTGGSVTVPAGIENGETVLIGRLFTGTIKLMPAVENPLGEKMLPRAKIKVLDSYSFKLGVEDTLSPVVITDEYSGDIKVQIAGGWDTQGIVEIEQEGLPLTILAIALDVKTGG